MELKAFWIELRTQQPTINAQNMSTSNYY